MNELQKKEFELLEVFIDLCNKLNLKYYLVCGTALGAVKYGGFIPWDDDVDVALARDDYEVFISKAQEFLPEHIFLQNYKTDPAFTHVFSKLRDSKTTYIEKSVAHLDINHGVYIDIFPLDGYPLSKKEITKFEFQKKVLSYKISCVYNAKRNLKGKILCFVERLFGCHKRTYKYVSKLDSLYSGCKLKDSRFWCNYGNWQGKLEYAPKEQYGNGIEMSFEGKKVIVPERFDEYLSQKYGNWRKDLPKEERKGHHYYTVMDLNKSYTEYLIKEEKNG